MTFIIGFIILAIKYIIGYYNSGDGYNSNYDNYDNYIFNNYNNDYNNNDHYSNNIYNDNDDNY